jgi:hypothetical protein
VGVRELTNNNPRLTTAAVGIAVALAVAWALWSVRGSPPPQPNRVTQFFFSTDDGKSWFLDDVSKLPPFQKDGKEALRAYVYKCGADGKPYVACLGRYTANVRAQLQAIYARDPKGQDPLIMRQIEQDGLEVKAPGPGGAWMKRSDPRAAELVTPRCPDGASAEPVSP